MSQKSVDGQYNQLQSGLDIVRILFSLQPFKMQFQKEMETEK